MAVDYSTLLRGAAIYDGLGSLPGAGDLAIAGERLAAVEAPGLMGRAGRLVGGKS